MKKMKKLLKSYFERRARLRAVKLALKADSRGERISGVAEYIHKYIKEGTV